MAHILGDKRVSEPTGGLLPAGPELRKTGFLAPSSRAEGTPPPTLQGRNLKRLLCLLEGRCVCMCACCVHIYMCMFVCVHMCVLVCAHVDICVSMFLCVCICTHACFIIFT